MAGVLTVTTSVVESNEIFGIIKPLLMLFTCSMLLASATDPSVLIATWAMHKYGAAKHKNKKATDKKYIFFITISFGNY